jgi:NADPH:quinone reductase-like Zn-dependent oxidoreductase
MKAVGVRDFGGPEALQVLELPEPVAGPGELRIRVCAVTVNPADRNIRTGFWVEPTGQPLYVPGWEAAGVVDAIGEGTVTDLTVGERVMAIVVPSGAHGAYAEKVVVPAGSVARVPKSANDAEAASLPMNGLTAYLALEALGIGPGGTIAVTGSAGAVGGYAIQLAKAARLRVIADASDQDERLVRDLGADIVVARGNEFTSQVLAHAPDGVDGLVDAGVVGDSVAPALRDGGRVSTLRGYAATVDRGVVFVPVLAGNHKEASDVLDRLRELADSGQLSLRVADVYSAADASEAHRRLDAGGVRGRLILTF